MVFKILREIDTRVFMQINRNDGKSFHRVPASRGQGLIRGIVDEKGHKTTRIEEYLNAHL